VISIEEADEANVRDLATEEYEEGADRIESVQSNSSLITERSAKPILEMSNTRFLITLVPQDLRLSGSNAKMR
jgi:hypothetical protein